MSEIKTGLMYSELTQCIYWGKINTKTGVAQGNKKDITSDFVGTMLQKFPINTRQNITQNGEVECVVIVLDEEKAKEYINAKEENAQLKENEIELLGLLQGLLDAEGVIATSNNRKVIKSVIQKHKGSIIPNEHPTKHNGQWRNGVCCHCG